MARAGGRTQPSKCANFITGLKTAGWLVGDDFAKRVGEAGTDPVEETAARVREGEGLWELPGLFKAVLPFLRLAPLKLGASGRP